jgi:hypothetical protein
MHLRLDPFRSSAALIIAAAFINASFNLVRVPAPLEPFVAIGSDPIMLDPN